MQDPGDWEFPENLRPKSNSCEFSLTDKLDAVVKIRSMIPDEAFTADILGTERLGSGVVIGSSGLILTIGYLITEARDIWVTTNNDKSVPGHALAYDQTTGFGLIQALDNLNVPHITIENHQAVKANDRVILASYGGRRHALDTNVVKTGEFAGYWEYVLDNAIFTSPPHPQWGGAALLNSSGSLVGIGSLFLQELFEGQSQQGNMVVPTSIVFPILDNLITHGHSGAEPRPWLGMYTVESEGKLIVSSLAHHGPAEISGVAQGDQIIDVNGQAISSLANLFRSIWRLGAAGVSVPITFIRDDKKLNITVKSVDRNDYLIKPNFH